MAETILTLDAAELTLDGNAGRVEILKGISLDVSRGETLGLVGPSGSGKSSLLMLMGGLERATGGRVEALGHDLTALGEDALARFRREHMGVVFQSFHLIPTMTALENVATPLELAGAKDAFDRAGVARPETNINLRSLPKISEAQPGNASPSGTPASGSPPEPSEIDISRDTHIDEVLAEDRAGAEPDLLDSSHPQE